MKLCVEDISGARPILRPVTGGIPLAEQAAPAGSVFTLAGPGGRTVPLQATVLGRWKDGSARWVLLDFMAAPSPRSRLNYRLCWGKAGKTITGQAGTKSPHIQLEQASPSTLMIADRLETKFVLTDAQGARHEACFLTSEIETQGPVRTTTVFTGEFKDTAGTKIFSCRLRLSLFAGSQRVRLEPLILIDAAHDIVQKITSLRLELKPRTGWTSARIGGTPGWQSAGLRAAQARLFQVDDEHYGIAGGAKGKRAPGWIEVSDAKGKMAVALRDFWQQWPKALTIDRECMSIELFPLFKAGQFDHMKPGFKHDYLFEGNCYRLRIGQARRWEIWLDLDGNGADLARSINAPLVPAADPVQALATGVWGEIAPAGVPAMRAYDGWAEALFRKYERSIRDQRDYGAMNWGDWFGERFVNWGNHEYDTPRHLLVQFARTGNPHYFHVGDAAARHMAEVDVVHAVNPELTDYFQQTAPWQHTRPSRPGMVHEHCVGHVGGFHSIEQIRYIYDHSGLNEVDRGYLCLEPFNLGHVWTEGLVAHYWLTGDPWTRETIHRIADNLAKLAEDGQNKWMEGSHCGREAGWPLLALAAAYELDWSPHYEKALKTIADAALAAQDPVCGGWLYQLPPDHCNCKTNRHVGKAGFILSILVNGLSKYGELSGDPRIPKAVQRAITHLNNDTWKDERSDWRYTSCPASEMINQIGVTILSLVYSVRLSNDPEHLRILRKAWQAKFKQLRLAAGTSQGDGKIYSHKMIGSAEAASLLIRKNKYRP